MMDTATLLREDDNLLHLLTRSDDLTHKRALLSYLPQEMKPVTGTETGTDWAVPPTHVFGRGGLLNRQPSQSPNTSIQKIITVV